MREEVLAGKEAVVSEIVEKFKNAQSAVIVEYRGLSVADTMDLRRQLRAEDIEFKVYKNTMTQRAVKEAGYEGLLDFLTGPNAIAFSTDAVAPSRVLAKFARKKPKLVIKQGMVEGSIVDVARITEIALLPNRDGMMSMILSCFQAPIRNLAYALKAVAEQKGE